MTYIKLIVIFLCLLVIGLLASRSTDCATVWKTQGETAGEACFLEYPDSTEVTE